MGWSKGQSPGRGVLTACAALLVAGCIVLAQSPGPQPVPMPLPIAAPADIAYPGTIQLRVDATDTERHIFTIHETIPVRGGQPIVLLYPQWLPGHHSPVGRADMLLGLVIHAGDTRLEWVRFPRERARRCDRTRRGLSIHLTGRGQ
jgi:hypothetical protein